VIAADLINPLNVIHSQMTHLNTQPHILVFDSGVGGLSVLPHLQHELPRAHYTYVMDDDWCPYGEKTDDILLPRIVSVIGRAIELCRPQLVVIACNTASTLAMDTLRETFTLPFVGVVPALKPAVESTASGAVVLLATAATVDRDYIDDLWCAFGGQRQLIKVACSDLVLLAEEKLRGREVSADQLACVLRAIEAECFRSLSVSAQDDESISAFVLGCTHFPLLRDELESAWSQPCLWFDSGAAIARRVLSLVAAPEFDADSLALSPRDRCSRLSQWWCTSPASNDDLNEVFRSLGLTAAGRLPVICEGMPAA